MINLKELKLKKAYDSDRDNLIDDFFIPALLCSVLYRRMAGFFSSGILSAAAHGVAGLIESEGKMMLIVGEQIHDEDFEAMQKATQDPKRFAEKILMKEIEKIEPFLTEEHVEALGWMLANDLLEIKIGLVTGGGLFHLKVGIIQDSEGNKLSFSGSDNETPSGWKRNIEEFKVFRGWVPEEHDWFETDEEKFERFWNGRADRVIVVDLPEAIRRKIIRSVPKKKSDLKIFQNHRKNESNVSDMKRRLLEPIKITLRPPQIKAVAAWMENGHRGILSMATGTGKTKAALAIVSEVEKERGPLCVVLALPYAHLARQWIENDIRLQFPQAAILEAHSGATGWQKKIRLYLEGFRAGTFQQLFIVTLYTTLASPDFLSNFKTKDISPANTLFIGDEVHNLGAPISRRGMIEEFGMRLGLSATPTRYFDEDGTSEVLKYFSGVVYEYSIKEAIADGYLVHYDYHPIPVEFTPTEYDEYIELSKKVNKKIASTKRESSDHFLENADLQRLLLERSKIIKKSENKLKGFEVLVRDMKLKGRVEHLLVYCDDMGQLERVKDVLNNLGVLYQKFTEEESIQDRVRILSAFSERAYQCLVAIRCLDEGVDVPSVKTAVIIASTTNPREYIQRRGRVLRKDPKDPEKKKAVIYDFVVFPPRALDPSLMKIERGILKKELGRVKEFLETADNKAEIYSTLLEVMSRYGVLF